eukprot:3660776-Rhodomonas_salina.1
MKRQRRQANSIMLRQGSRASRRPARTTHARVDTKDKPQEQNRGPAYCNCFIIIPRQSRRAKNTGGVRVCLRIAVYPQSDTHCSPAEDKTETGLGKKGSKWTSLGSRTRKELAGLAVVFLHQHLVGAGLERKQLPEQRAVVRLELAG